ncbi:MULTISPECIES: oxygen-insensitive NAD(P)H nitroreductase [Acinetobacter]|jgi:nitroreductase/dihydropteridine reductase|uniref:oxygen-insensitive NAD(P)H nitroreductase n=1 Tax=Acinetobacter TaxID=469 RepID=UPI0002AE99ED|nr:MULTISPECIES: oxygen-insensitive NAD(P)H nitroreductase [Acinetobacter]ATZ63928.1 NAD(P)H nitroreductase [Acinetobacter bereziniae]ELW90845.1 putative oxygen-insensitive NAD(P)H nitroreductase [Acinetobacter sp. WC-743]MBJ8424653.1 oxygen-insensitive NAD(P)H nitroreductase [Acinetobacter bereziniae]MBJ8473805.1 oxygen-insensitive NAD(P)H nitroreductase [Acinetobacter bereziniae]MBJ9372547.1 oxygen-insensitive NAD(P)H nitroreductase [Acinetobacter sp. TGL-Y2]
MDLLTVAKTRYTTKAYDATKKIPQEQFERLVEILRLTPSSINIQPWHFFIADHDEAKQRIAKALVGKYAYNAPKVLDSSHTILFCTKADISEQHLADLLQQDDLSGRFKDEKAKQGQKESRSGYVSYYRNEKGDIQRWAENQTFIALGQMLLAAGIEGIDATPIGGFDEAILTEELGLTEKNLIPSVIMTLGYRSDVDFNAKLPKSRLAQKDVITRL